MTDTALRKALHELRLDFTSPKGLVALTCVGLIFGLSGPFGTFHDLAVGPRIAYWLVQVFATYATGSMINHYLQIRHGDWPSSFALRSLFLGTATACGVFVVVTLINLVTFGTPYNGLRGAALAGGMVWSISVIVVAILAIFAPLIDDDADTTPLLLDRLPTDLRGPLLTILAEADGVRITTTHGQAFVPISLSAAIAEAHPTAGLLIDDAHWVARDAILRVTSGTGGATLTLTDGREIAIASKVRDDLRAAGVTQATLHG